MKCSPLAIALLLRLLICPKPDRCPYCPADMPMHWTHWGSYTRYAGDPDDPYKRVAVARYWCPIAQHSFSLLPDSLLPYCRSSTALVLQWLHALLVEHAAVNTIARNAGVSRGMLRCLKTRCLRTLPKLRLPWHEGALDAKHFLALLAQAGALAVADLFRLWKQGEPKLSIVGIYAR